MLTLESILEDLQRQGQKDSSGRFSLDPSQALPKLKQYRLPDPHAYVLKLLQAAVRGGASTFDLHSGTGRVAVQMSGIRLPIERLPHVFLELLAESSSGNPALEHLAVGLHSSLGTRAQAIRLHYWDGQRGVKIEWRVDGQSVKDWASCGPPLCRVELERVRQELWREVREKLNSRPIFSMLAGASAGYDNEQLLLHGTGDLAPLAVSINGKPLPPSSTSFSRFRRFLPSRKLFKLEYCFGAGDGPGFRLPDREQATLSMGRTPSCHYGAYLAMQNGQGPQHLLIVRDGVLLRRMQFDSSQPCFVMILDGYQLTTDLTTLSFIEDDYFRDFFRKAQVFAADPGQLTLPRI
jgi:hypothetical protein